MSDRECRTALIYNRHMAPPPFDDFSPEQIFSQMTIGVLYFWKAGDTRISEMMSAGTEGPTGA